MITQLRKALHFTLHIGDRYHWLRTAFKYVRVFYTITFSLFFLLLVLSDGILLIWSPESLHGAWDRGQSVFLIGLGCIIATLLVIKWNDNLTAKRDRLREQVALKNGMQISIPPGGGGGLMLMSCPACGDVVKLEELQEHVEDHLSDLRNPIHAGVPVAMLLRRKGSTEWEKIPVMTDGG